jgi:hypothetical protein
MELIVSVSEMRDESVLRFYDNVRAHVEAERGNQHKFMTRDALKEYVESLRAEMLRRRLQFTPIDFGTNQPPVSRVEKSETSELSLVVESVASADNTEAKISGESDQAGELSENLRKSIEALLKKPGVAAVTPRLR